RLAAHYGRGLCDDEIPPLPEPSIELEVVFLQYLYKRRRPVRIVPLLVGPFQDCVDTAVSPMLRADVARMVRALRRAEEENREPGCSLLSGDPAPRRPQSRDPRPVRGPVPD